MRILLLIFLFIPFYLQAQHQLADSLLSALSAASSDSVRVVIHNKLSKHYLLTDTRKAQEHGQEAARLAAVVDFPVGRAKALNMLGVAHLIHGEYDLALQRHHQALKVVEHIPDTAEMISTYLNMGNAYNKIHDETRALRNYHIASVLAYKTNAKLKLGKTFNNIGTVYENQKKYAKAMLYYRKAAAMQEEAGDKQSLAVSLLNIGNLHLFDGQPKDGLPYLFRSLCLDEEIRNEMNPITTLRSVARIYMAMGENNRALKYGMQSYEMARKVGSVKKTAEAAQLMQELYASIKNFELAYNYLSLHHQQEDLLDIEKQQKAAAETAAKYETEAKELENKNLKAEQKKQEKALRNQQIIMILGGAVLILMLVLLVVLYISRKRVRGAFSTLQETHHLMQAQQLEIISQKNEILTQAAVLRAQNEQLEKHKHFRTKIFSIISHDLRNPFNGVKGVLNLVQRKSMTESQTQHIFGLLGRDIDVAISMLQNVLIWSKAQLEEAHVNLEPVQLQQLVNENIQLATAHAEEKSIRFQGVVAEDAVVLADKERLNFVLRNLLTNAIKFTFEGGLIQVTAIVQQEQVVLSVSDDGVGIPSKYIQKLFTEERFTTPGTANEKGTGLGLMLCKEFVEHQNGSIRAESEEGKGSTFSITLQRATTFILEPSQELAAVALA